MGLDLNRRSGTEQAGSHEHSLDVIQNFISPWIRTREAFSPISFAEFNGTVTDIDRTQFDLLRVIVNGAPRPLNQLARAANLTMSSASRLVESLVQLGLIERVTPGSDRRVTVIHATEAARQHIAEFNNIGASLLAGPLSNFTHDEVAAFSSFFNRLAPIIEQWADRPDEWVANARSRRHADASNGDDHDARSTTH